MSGRDNYFYDVTGPHVQTGPGGRSFLLRFDELERVANSHQPTGRCVRLTMTRAEAATLADQLQAALSFPELDKENLQ